MLDPALIFGLTLARIPGIESYINWMVSGSVPALVNWSLALAVSPCYTCPKLTELEATSIKAS
jgi:hypothetical protein